MDRFFVPPDSIRGDDVLLRDPRLVHQLRNVLRLKPGESITLLDNTGWEYSATIAALSPNEVSGVVMSKTTARGEPKVEIILYQGLLKGQKLELVLQKGTELGVRSFVPTLCQRSQARDRPSPQKLVRWRRILQEAAEQSRRGRVPELKEPVPFAQACASAPGLVLMPWEEEKGVGLRGALELRKGAATISLFVGPEGGFTPAEAALATDKGTVLVSLGERILRAETAGLVVAAALCYQYGELGG